MATISCHRPLAWLLLIFLVSTVIIVNGNADRPSLHIQVQHRATGSKFLISWIDRGNDDERVLLSSEEGLLFGENYDIESRVDHEFEVEEMPQESTNKCKGENGKCRTVLFQVNDNKDQIVTIADDFTIEHRSSEDKQEVSNGYVGFLNFLLALWIISATMYYTTAEKVKADAGKEKEKSRKEKVSQAEGGSEKEKYEKGTERSLKVRNKTNTAPKSKPKALKKRATASSHSRYVRRFAGHMDNVLDMSVSPDGEWMATSGEDGQLRVAKVDADSNVYLRVNVDNHDRICALSWSADSRTLVCAFRKSSDITFYRMRKKRHPENDEQHSGSFPYELVELNKRRFPTSSNFDDDITDCIVDQSHSFCLVLATGSKHATVAWDGKLGDSVGVIKTGSGGIRLSGDGRFVCGRGEGTSAEVKIYEVQRKKQKGEAEPVFDKLSSKSIMTLISDTKVSDIAFFGQTCDRAVVCGVDGTIQVWNLNVEYNFGENPKLLCVTKIGKKPTRLAVSSNGTRIAVVTDCSALHLFTYVATPEPSISCDFVVQDTHPEGVGDVKFCPTRNVVYTRSNASKEVFAWNTSRVFFCIK